MNHNLWIYFGILLYMVALSACQNTGKTEPVKLLGKVNDRMLYQSDFEDWLEETKHTKDSSYLEEFVKSWLIKQLIIQKALNDDKIDQKNIKKKVTEYQNTLLVHEYQKVYIEKNLDTTITQKNIEDYLETNQSHLALKDDLVKGIIIKIRRTKYAEVAKIKRHIEKQDLTSISPNFIEEVIKISEDYRFFTENWVFFNTLYFMLPRLSPEHSLNIVKSKKLHTLRNSDYIFLVKIIDYRLTGEIPPLNFVKNRIKNNIINKRKSQLIEQLENDIQKNEKESYQIYLNK